MPTDEPGGLMVATRADPSAASTALAVDTYLRVRRLEGRVFPDDLVARLPNLPVDHPLYTEWRLRGESADRLVAYLGRRRAPQRILDVGCGNGWLANRIAQLDGTTVIGVDVNVVELDQAARVFGERANLSFRRGDVTALGPTAERFDVIVLATVVQYVEDLPGLVRRLRDWLEASGEIHIVDSPFYRADEVAAARDRSRIYYAGLGVPEMAEGYHHHRLDELSEFGPEVLRSPDAWRIRLERRLFARARAPFPWLRIIRASGT